MARKIKPNHGIGTKPYVWTEQHQKKTQRDCEWAENVLKSCIFLCSLLSMPKWACALCVSVCRNHHHYHPPKWVAFAKGTYFIWFDTVWLSLFQIHKKPHLYDEIYNDDALCPPMRALYVFCVTGCRRFRNEHTKSPSNMSSPFYLPLLISIYLVCVCLFSVSTLAIRRQHTLSTFFVPYVLSEISPISAIRISQDAIPIK